MIIRHAQPPSGNVSSRKESRPSTPAPDTDTDYHRPSFSDATPRPTPSQPRPLGQESNTTSILNTVDGPPPTSKRLAFFADKLSGASSSQSHIQPSTSTSGHRASPVPSHSNNSLLPPRSHSRADSTRDPSSLSPMASSSSPANASKVHTSPSKVSCIRHTGQSIVIL